MSFEEPNTEGDLLIESFVKEMASKQYALNKLEEGQVLPTGGTCSVFVALTINLGNFENIKVNVGFTEPYSGMENNTRDNKYYELKETAMEKLQDAVIDYTKGSKELSNEIHKYLKKKRDEE